MCVLKMSTTTATNSSISFVVILDNPRKKIKPKVSKRLVPNTSVEELNRKQQQADKRRQAQKDAKLARMKQRQEQCKRIAMKMETLMELDAKRKVISRTEAIPTVSKRQAAAMIQSVAEDFKEIGISLRNDVAITHS